MSSLLISRSDSLPLFQVKSSSPKDGTYVSLGSPSVSGSGQTECDTDTSQIAESSSVKTELSDVKKQLFSDVETNTVSSSGK